MKKLFDDSNLPYGTLEKFGLSQEMIEDLPLDVLEVIQDGGLSPVLPVSVQISPEESAGGRTRFQFVVVEDGKVDVLFYPLLEAVDLDRFPQADQEKLQAGMVQTVKTVGLAGTPFPGLMSTTCLAIAFINFFVSDTFRENGSEQAVVPSFLS